MVVSTLAPNAPTRENSPSILINATADTVFLSKPWINFIAVSTDSSNNLIIFLSLMAALIAFVLLRIVASKVLSLKSTYNDRYTSLFSSLNISANSRISKPW